VLLVVRVALRSSGASGTTGTSATPGATARCTRDRRRRIARSIVTIWIVAQNIVGFLAKIGLLRRIEPILAALLIAEPLAILAPAAITPTATLAGIAQSTAITPTATLAGIALSAAALAGIALATAITPAATLAAGITLSAALALSAAVTPTAALAGIALAAAIASAIAPALVASIVATLAAPPLRLVTSLRLRLRIRLRLRLRIRLRLRLRIRLRLRLRIGLRASPPLRRALLLLPLILRALAAVTRLRSPLLLLLRLPGAATAPTAPPATSFAAGSRAALRSGIAGIGPVVGTVWSIVRAFVVGRAHCDFLDLRKLRDQRFDRELRVCVVNRDGRVPRDDRLRTARGALCGREVGLCGCVECARVQAQRRRDEHGGRIAFAFGDAVWQRRIVPVVRELFAEARDAVGACRVGIDDLAETTAEADALAAAADRRQELLRRGRAQDEERARRWLLERLE
jgi:hypothetical protein